MRIVTKIRKYALLFVLPLLFVFGGTAFADYGGTPYGRCLYGVKSSCTSTSTTVTTPSGLEVAVNLKDGQVIPPTGYDVTITPLNGKGSSFASADIYIDGVKVATVYPASNGTAIWHWDTEKYPSGDIKIVVFDTSGKSTDMPFKVTIGTATPAGSSGDNTGASSGGWFGAQLTETISGKAKDFIRALPPRIITAFPYLLFLLILIEISILIYQTRREVYEVKRLKALAERERDIIDMKQKFTALVSHYLRTPLTILQGGAEGYAADPASGEKGKQLLAQVKSIHQTVESIVGHTAGKAVPNPIVSSAGEAAKVGTAKILAIWVPVALVGLLAAMFIYLAVSINKYNASAISLFTQLVIYSILIVLVYLAVRQWQMRRKGVAAARLVLEQEKAVQASQDTVIGEAATRLLQEKTLLEQQIAALPQGNDNARFIRSGFTRLSKTIDRFVIASKLRGSVSTEPFVSASLDGLVKQASAESAPAAEQKHVVIRPVDHQDVMSRNPGLLSLVLQTLIDNAVSYSNDNGTVEVGVQPAQAETQLYVADHGEGLTAEEIKTLFQPFNRLEEVETFNREGLGFSLYLDKLIMKYLGGDINVESTPREVTRFLLTLPSATIAKQ